MIRTVLCISMVFLVFLMSGCGRETVTGKWTLDKERVNTKMLKLMKEELGTPPDTETIEMVHKQTDAIECKYQFHADGNVHISYNMSPSSFGEETGKWWQEGSIIRIETKKTSGTGTGKVGNRVLQVVGKYLVWDDSRGMRWFLKKQ